MAYGSSTPAYRTGFDLFGAVDPANPARRADPRFYFNRFLKKYDGEPGTRAIWQKTSWTFVDADGRQRLWPSYWIGLKQAPKFLHRVIRDGVGLLNEYYDFSSEENLLRNLPKSEKIWVQGGMELTMGIKQCLAHIVIGDFDFVEYYRSEAVKTVYPKYVDAIEKLLIPCLI